MHNPVQEAERNTLRISAPPADVVGDRGARKNGAAHAARSLRAAGTRDNRSRIGERECCSTRVLQLNSSSRRTTRDVARPKPRPPRGDVPWVASDHTLCRVSTVCCSTQILQQDTECRRRAEGPADHVAAMGASGGDRSHVVGRDPPQKVGEETLPRDFAGKIPRHFRRSAGSVTNSSSQEWNCAVYMKSP